MIKKKKNHHIRVMVIKALSTILQLYRGGQFLLVEETGESHRPATSH